MFPDRACRDNIPDTRIRRSIERLVGIVPNMSGVPKAIKSRRFVRMNISKTDSPGELKQDTLPSPPTIPLSKGIFCQQRKALLAMSSPPHVVLERLEEEDENDSRIYQEQTPGVISMASML